ncbi:MAG: right-handed parallel beta-helix repeat-containing protein [Candidatus Omnitrophica bacterium]|nr:right-handed parallel beta-helix repeat-containing protein [Candidatus Omnitrophota bacterium]
MKSHRHTTRVIESLVGIVLFVALALPVEAQSVARVTPMDFGAVGNGFIDDSTAVQEALNSGQIIELVSGKYKITQSLQIPTGGGIQGPGTLIHAFDLLPPATPDTSHAALVSSGNDILLENFRIAKQFADGSYSNGVVFQNGEGLRIKNLEISGYSARYGIHLIEVSNFEVSGCYIHDFRMNASADMIEDSPAGLRVTRSHNGTISGNRILKIEVGSTGRASISPIRPDYGPQGYQSDCMTIQECEGVTIEGNVCITSGEGVDLLLSKSCILTGNVISDTWLGGENAGRLVQQCERQPHFRWLSRGSTRLSPKFQRRGFREYSQWKRIAEHRIARDFRSPRGSAWSDWGLRNPYFQRGIRGWVPIQHRERQFDRRSPSGEDHRSGRAERWRSHEFGDRQSIHGPIDGELRKP